MCRTCVNVQLCNLNQSYHSVHCIIKFQNVYAKERGRFYIRICTRGTWKGYRKETAAIYAQASSVILNKINRIPRQIVGFANAETEVTINELGNYHNYFVRFTGSFHLLGRLVKETKNINLILQNSAILLRDEVLWHCLLCRKYTCTLPFPQGVLLWYSRSDF